MSGAKQPDRASFAVPGHAAATFMPTASHPSHLPADRLPPLAVSATAIFREQELLGLSTQQ